jgi:transmembrane sensor
MEDEQYYKLLVQRFADRIATDEELEIFIKLANAGKLDAYLTEAMNRDAGITEEDEKNFPVRAKIRPLWPLITAAASILLILSVGSYFISRQKPADQQTAQLRHDLNPGTNGAILTLASGRKLILEKTKIGIIAPGVQKSNDSLLVYKGSEDAGYNTLETPKGRQYAVVLPDGSKVWLNAASSLRYPTQFSGKERMVELTGEGYFEVVHNSKMPFRVKSNNQITEDIGTSFNISSYKDEKVITTTLIEGAIKVNDRVLRPGQASTLANNGAIQVNAVDIEVASAWRHGLFKFKQADVATVMRQIARWYDVEIKYEGQIPKGHITGSVYRDVDLSRALKILAYLNINIKTEGRTITIRSNNLSNNKASKENE